MGLPVSQIPGRKANPPRRAPGRSPPLRHPNTLYWMGKVISPPPTVTDPLRCGVVHCLPPSYYTVHVPEHCLCFVPSCRAASGSCRWDQMQKQEQSKSDVYSGELRVTSSIDGLAPNRAATQVKPPLAIPRQPEALGGQPAHQGSQFDWPSVEPQREVLTGCFSI